MKIIIQAIIILVAITLIIVGLSSRSTHSGRAWKKLALILLAIAMIASVLSPAMLNDIAHLVGVGRGADLLLYVSVITFIFYALNSYLRQQDERDKLTRLARTVAIMDANERYNIRKS